MTDTPKTPRAVLLAAADQSHGALIGHNNREAVRTFFASHIGCTNVECGRFLGLSTVAVGRHVATIRKEWTARLAETPDHARGDG